MGLRDCGGWQSRVESQRIKKAQARESAQCKEQRKLGPLKEDGRLRLPDSNRSRSFCVQTDHERAGLVAIVVAPAISVTIMVAIPAVVVIETTAAAFPVATVVAATFMARTDPAGADIGRASPVSAMPAVVMPDGIPIAVNPNIIGPRAHRYDIVAWGWRSADFNADADLGSGTVSA